MNITIYNTQTGHIDRVVNCPADHAEYQLSAGEEFYLNCPATATHIIDDEPVTIAPPPPTTGMLLAEIRHRRDGLLKSSDWTQLPDAPCDRQAWAAYRQALRDFPEICDPTNPAWPVRS